MKKIFLLILCLFIFSACTVYHIDSKDITRDYYPSKESSRQVAYMDTIRQPHEIIGYVTVNTERRQRISDVMDKMKYEAAILGGDAITDIQTDATGQWKKLPGQKIIGNAFVRANFTAAVAVFK